VDCVWGGGQSSDTQFLLVSLPTILQLGPMRLRNRKPVSHVRHRFKAAGCFFAILAVGLPVYALSFNITYDSSVSNRADYAQIRTAINYVVLEYTSLFTNPISINILVVADPSIGGGESYENTTPLPIPH
jgi:hypothetical protein